MKRYIQNINKKGFTLAEVLITLSIIGIIAAILFPSILANYNERTLKAKRQALLARMSQAMAELGGQFANYEDINCVTDGVDTCSAFKFISEGLSSVYKLAATCDSDSLSACDFPTSITLTDGSKFTFNDTTSTLKGYNDTIKISSTFLVKDSKAAAFMTKNGESILLYFNPNCAGKTQTGMTSAEAEMCVNMIYDLNGAKKKPNKMDEDIGFMTVFYSNMPTVVSPRIVDFDKFPDYESTEDEDGNVYIGDRAEYTYNKASEICANVADGVATLPSFEDGMAMQINLPILRDLTKQTLVDFAWTKTAGDGRDAIYVIILRHAADQGLGFGTWNPNAADPPKAEVRCIYKNNN